MKPFSTACERNKNPILDIIQNIFIESARVLEIGTGTGQHAVYFAEKLPHLLWQTSDVDAHHSGIHAWINESKLSNVFLPLSLDVNEQNKWPQQEYLYGYTANTCHIMSLSEVEKMFAIFGSALKNGGSICIYGPFNYNGKFTSESNAAFDHSLRSTNPQMGIRDIEQITTYAAQNNMILINDYKMPANNRLLHFEKNN